MVQTCLQDQYYSNVTLTSCGSVVDYSQCGLESNPGCCPDGLAMVSIVDDCTFNGSVPGRQFMCMVSEPEPTNEVKKNCCAGTEIPEGNPVGYCPSGFCVGSPDCELFFYDHCLNSNYTKPECSQFCQQNPSVCFDSTDPKDYPQETVVCETESKLLKIRKRVQWILIICVLLLLLNLIVVIPKFMKKIT
jgi:hypothetical protein